MWLQGANTWIYPHLHQASRRMSALVLAHPSADGLRRRALTQALRELLMAQASDWAFIMATGTAVDYARMRTRQHLARFVQLDRQITRGTLDTRFVAECETRTPCFPWLDYRVHR